MEDPKVIPELRPSEVVMAYWQEVLTIEEDAEVHDVEYLEAA